MSSRTEEELEQQMVREMKEGIDGSGIKAGLIGEIGCSWPLTDNEAKVLRAASKAQIKCGCCLMVHPGRNVNAPMQVCIRFRKKVLHSLKKISRYWIF